jgi:hypothetical protein
MAPALARRLRLISMVVDVDDELAFVEYLKWEYKFEEASLF